MEENPSKNEKGSERRKNTLNVDLGGRGELIYVYMSNGQYSRIRHEEKECREM